MTVSIQAQSDQGINTRSPSLLHSPFLWKLYAGFSILIILSSFVMGSLIARSIEQNTLSGIQNSLHANAILLKEIALGSLSENNSADEQLQNRVLLVGRKIGTRLTVIRADGIVIADSDKDPAVMDNHASRPEVLAAKSGGTGTSTRFSRTTNSYRMFLAISVMNREQIIGYARTSLPLTVIDQRLSALRQIIYLCTVLTTVAALLLGLLLARHVVKPLFVMTSVIERITKGEQSEKLSTTRTDEFGKLAIAFNQLADNSQARMEMLTTDRNKLSVILGGMVEGVIAVNKNQRVLHMNDAAGKLLQVTSLNTLERPIWEVVRIREISEILRDAISNDADFQRKLELITVSTNRSIEMHASALHDGNGKLVGAVVVLHDVTKIDQLEAIRRDFVANASHELKTPVTAIRMIVETMLDDDTLSPEKQTEFLSRVQKQSLRLSFILNDMLTLSRIESPSEEHIHISLDLRECIRAAVVLLSPLGVKKEVSVEVNLPDQSPSVIGNKAELNEVVNNLLDNALKYSSAGGEIIISLFERDHKAIIEIQDAGTGIPKQDQQRIFERFYQVDKARSRESGGTGLGLSIVKHIVLSHGGTIEVDSTLGTGSTFRVILPVHESYTTHSPTYD